MKKKILFITTFSLLLGSSIGFAAASSPLIGAKVQGLFTVQKADGTKIGEAVIINGSAYAPVRAVSEASGAELTVEGKTIIMGSKPETTPATSETTQTEQVETPTPTIMQIPLTAAEKEILQTRISKSEQGLENSREELSQAKTKLETSADATEKEKLSKTIKELEARIAGLQKSLDADKARLAAEGQ